MNNERSNQFHLIKEILLRSTSQNWDEAKKEWRLIEIYREEEPQTCLCTHFPIIEICVLKNITNESIATVGNVCVNKFLGIKSESIFAGLRRIVKHPEKGLNSSATIFAHKQGWINDWEKEFCLNTARKRLLSEKQRAKRQQINTLVLSKVTNTLNATAWGQK